jgi:hypothetical protein
VAAALRSQWAVIVAMGLIGAVVGGWLAFFYNSSIQPSWMAEAAVSFVALGESTSGSEGGVRVEDEAVRAELLLEETLSANPDLAIDVDEDRLVFVASGTSADQALEEALTFRAEYQSLGSTVLSAEQIDAALTELLAELQTTYAQIALLGGNLTDRQFVEQGTEVAPAVVGDDPIDALRRALIGEIASLVARQARLDIWLDNPEIIPADEDGNVPSEAELTAEYETNEAVLIRLRERLAGLPVSTATTEERLELEALQNKAADLETQYVNLLTRRDSGVPGFYEDPVVIDETRDEQSVVLGAVAGGLVGALLAAAIAIGVEASRRPIRIPSDLAGYPVLGVVSTARKKASDTGVWYPDSFSVRRRDVQALRDAVDSAGGDDFTLAFTGVGDASGKRWHDTAALAADVAAAHAVAGRRVLLIDANPRRPADLPEYGYRVVTLGAADDGWTETGSAGTGTSLAGLDSLHIGVVDGVDPADAFASASLGTLVADAKLEWDVIVLACPDVSEPVAAAALRRVDLAVLAASLGKATVSDVTTAFDVLVDRGIRVAGITLLDPGGRFTPAGSALSRRAPAEEDEEIAPNAELGDVPLWNYEQRRRDPGHAYQRGTGDAGRTGSYTGTGGEADRP